MDNPHKIVRMDESRPLVDKKKRRQGLIVLLVLSLILLGIIIAFSRSTGKSVKTLRNYTSSTVQSQNFISKTEASGTIVAPVQISVTSPQEGYASKVLVKEGDSVSKGQVVAILDVPDLYEDQDDLEAQLTVAKIELQSLEISHNFSSESLQIELERLEKKIEKAQKELQLQKELSELKSSRLSEYETALDDLNDLLDEKQDKEIEIAKEIKTYQIDVDKQKATIHQIELSVKRNAEDIAEATVTSPMAGQVLSISEELLVPGTLMEVNDELMVVADRSQTYFDLELNEQYADVVSVGTLVSVSSGAKTIESTITAVGQVASLSSDGLSATITVRAKPNTDETLTVGGAVVGTLVLGNKPNTLVLPRGAWLTTGGQKYVFKIEGNKAYKTQASFGETQGLLVEVKSGLSAGDVIISSGYQDILDQDEIILE